MSEATDFRNEARQKRRLLFDDRFVSEETRKKQTLARMAIIHEGEQYEADFTKSRMRRLLCDIPGITYREVQIEISRRDEKLIAMDFAEYKLSRNCGDYDFWEAADAASHEATQIADVMLLRWKNISQAINGTILEFRRVWSVPSCPKGLWTAAANHFIEQEFPRHGVLLLKAYPLEYEGQVRKGDGFIMRQRAMVRRYKHHLNVDVLDDNGPGDFWMYRMNPENPSAAPSKKRNNKHLADVFDKYLGA